MPSSDAWQGRYSKAKYTILETESAMEAVQRMSEFNIGLLATLDDQGKVSGLLSERDLICKVALLDLRPQDVLISDIKTTATNIITVTSSDTIMDCMELMLKHNCRHLPIVNDNKCVVGMLTISDCCRAVLKEKETTIEMLEKVAAGKSGTFVVD